MGIRLRFNLVLTTVFLLGLAVSGVVSYELLHKNAREEVIRKADLMIEVARAIRAYTVDEVRPGLTFRLEKEFFPQTVPAYAASETLNRLPEAYRNYIYKEATLNPTNLRDRAADWEADLVQAFKRDPNLTHVTGEREAPSGRQLFVARPMIVNDQSCLTCHSEPRLAPASMVTLYGDGNGFGWKLHEIIGAQVVSVPMTYALQNARQAFITFMLSLCGIFVVLYLVLNIMLSRMIIAPITQMAQRADEVSMGNFDIPEFDDRRGDEIGRLAASFNRMRRSLAEAFRLFDSEERT